MPPKKPSNKIPLEWLKRARGSYARACQPKPSDGFWEDLCFDAQQAAEKAIKAVMIHKNIKAGAGDQNTLGIQNDGTLWTFGSNIKGELGLGDLTNRSIPTQVGNLSRWINVVGRGFSLALRF